MRQADEQRQRQPKKQEKPATAGDFWSFHPTAAERTALAKMMEDGYEAVDELEAQVRRGITITIGRSRTNDSIIVTARDSFANYGEGQALAVFHVELERALVGMCYVLNVKHPHWPTERATSAHVDFNW